MCSPETLSRFIEVGGYAAMQIETTENTKPVNVSAAEMMAAATKIAVLPAQKLQLLIKEERFYGVEK